MDEAFAAFAPPGASLLDDVGSLPENAVVVRSLTKELGLPGLRMGYLIAPATPSGMNDLGHKGVTVRDCASFGLCDYVRVAAPTKSDLSRVIRAIGSLRAAAVKGS